VRILDDSTGEVVGDLARLKATIGGSLRQRPGGPARSELPGCPTLLYYLLLLTLPVTAVALLYARLEYRRRGKLTLPGVFLLCLMLFVPNLVVEYATEYEMPSTPLDYFGVLLGLAGLVVCVAGIYNFRSGAKVFGMAAGKLTASGLYRWSRNPQYVGWLLFLLGFALNDWSLWCLAALLVEAISLHLLILVEEEHLRRVFGEGYAAFCDRVPRYAGWGRLRIWPAVST
jgi:protein-S-isoprenylcysteine O-methyltransferase Ste14